MILHLTIFFTTISVHHHLPTSTVYRPSSVLSPPLAPSPSPLCRRLEALAQRPLQPSGLDLKMFSLHLRSLYLIDEEDDLYVLPISEETVAKWLHRREELPLWVSSSWDDDDDDDHGHRTSGQQHQSWPQPVSKWYNHPWLRVDYTVNSPLARLQLFTDSSGTLWRKYLFVDGQHVLVNNRTGGREVMMVNFRDFLLVSYLRQYLVKY